MVHVHNRSPTSALQSSTPYTLWFKKKPDVSYFKVFGCTAYVHVQKDQRKGLQPHTKKCIFVGYPPQYKGWKFYNPDTKKFLISSTADFDERVYTGSSPQPIDMAIQQQPAPPTLDATDLDGLEDQVGVENTGAPQAPQAPQVPPLVIQQQLPPTPPTPPIAVRKM